MIFNPKLAYKILRKNYSDEYLYILGMYLYSKQLLAEMMEKK